MSKCGHSEKSTFSVLHDSHPFLQTRKGNMPLEETVH